MNVDYVHKDTLTATDYVELQKENEKIIQLNQLLIKEKNELKKKIATYEDPEDLTLMYMYCDIKAKDKIEELKNQLKEKEEYINKLQTTKDKLDKCNVENTKHQTKFKNYLLFESEKKEIEKITIREKTIGFPSGEWTARNMDKAFAHKINMLIDEINKIKGATSNEQ